MGQAFVTGLPLESCGLFWGVDPFKTAERDHDG